MIYSMYYDGNTVKLFTDFTYTMIRFKCSFLFMLSI